MVTGKMVWNSCVVWHVSGTLFISSLFSVIYSGVVNYFLFIFRLFVFRGSGFFCKGKGVEIKCFSLVTGIS